MSNAPILDDFLELVSIDAASRNERAIADAVKAKMAAFGIELAEDDAGEKIGGNTGNLLGVLDGGLPVTVLLNAHMDRVANGLGIKPVIKDGLITSDGTTILAADDLSGVAALIDSARRLSACGKKFPRVEYLFTVGEEAGLLGASAFDASKLSAKIGYAFDSPGRIGRVVCAAPGEIDMKIEVKGKAAHAGNCPEQGVNATVELAKVLATIRDGRLDFESTANFAVLECGTKMTNIVQAYASCKGEMRSRNAAKIAEYAEYVKKHIADANAASKAEISISVKQAFCNFSFGEDAPVVAAALAAIRDMGLEAEANGGGGGMDANIFNGKGISVVGVATGYSGNHGVSEQIYLDDLLRSGELAARIVMKHGEAAL